MQGFDRLKSRKAMYDNQAREKAGEMPEEKDQVFGHSERAVDPDEKRFIKAFGKNYPQYANNEVDQVETFANFKP